MIGLPCWPFVLFAGICGLLLTIQFIAQIIIAFSRPEDGVNL